MKEAKAVLDLGPWGTRERIDRFLETATGVSDLSARIAYISGQFLGVPYRHPTLIGSPDVPEELIVNLGLVDCFTYLDYVDGMRLSRSFDEFIEKLTWIRYKDGVVAYEKRRHFFTDWIDTDRVNDVTAEIGMSGSRSVTKALNARSDGSPFVPGIPTVSRTLSVAPPAIAPSAQGRLHTADYVGIFEETEGLDVSHVGLAIEGARKGSWLFRHASSVQGKVVDQDLNDYLASKPGIIVLRPQP